MSINSNLLNKSTLPHLTKKILAKYNFYAFRRINFSGFINMHQFCQRLLLLVGIIALFVLNAFSQETSPTPPAEEEPIKILTEEVNLNVRAQTESGKFVSELKADDLLIVDNGTPQEITRVQRVPANVILLLDTGAELNFAKSLRMTRLIAKAFVYGLQRENSLAVMQYYDKVETISDWGSDYESVIKALDTKLYTGKRSRFTDALNAVVNNFKSRPSQNRHLVLVSDGAETVADNAARQKAIQNLMAANITVHIISYTQLEEQAAQKATQRVKWGDGRTKPRVDPVIWDIALQGLPLHIKESLIALNEAQAIIIITLDNERIRRVRRKREDWRVKEADLQVLAEDSGGLFQAPETPETLLRLAVEIANAVDSYYVVTYLPKSGAGDSPDLANRKVRVGTHLNGVKIQSRHRIVLISERKTEAN